MPVDAPPTSLEAEVRKHDPWRLKGAVAVAQRRPHACIAEPDDVGAAVTGDVGQETWIALDRPARGFRPDRDRRNAASTEGARHAELIRCGLFPCQLRPGLATVL